MLTEKEKLDHADFKAMHMDTFSGIAAELVPHFLRAEIAGERETEALKHVSTWDMRLDAGSVGASIFNVWFARVAEAMLGSSAEHFYRLTVGALPVVTGVFPLSVATNTEADVQLVGVNLPPHATARLKTAGPRRRPSQ